MACRECDVVLKCQCNIVVIGRNVWSQSLPVMFVCGIYSDNSTLFTCHMACDLSGMAHVPLVQLQCDHLPKLLCI